MECTAEISGNVDVILPQGSTDNIPHSFHLAIGITGEPNVKIIKAHILDSINKTGMNHNPIIDRNFIQTRFMRTKFNAAMNEISAPIDKFKPITPPRKILPILRTLNNAHFGSIVINRTTVTIVRSVTSHKLHPKVLSDTIGIGDTTQRFPILAFNVKVSM